MDKRCIRMKKQKVILFSAYIPGVYPRGATSVTVDLLAPAILKAAAYNDTEIVKNYDIKILNFSTSENSTDIVKQILKEQPDILGCSVYIWNYDLISESSKLIKEAIPNIYIIWGGPQVSFNSQETIEKNPCVDVIVCGSGETIFKMILNAKLKTNDLSTIPSITYRNTNKDIINNIGFIQENLSEHPSPFQTNTINLNDGKTHSVFIESSRGCIFHCGYCMWKGNHGKNLNLFPIEYVLKNIEIIYNNPNVKAVVFTDACIFYTPDRAKIIIDKIASCKCKIPTVLTLDIAFLNENMINDLQKLNLSYQKFHFGMQSINQLTLELMNRHLGPDTITKKINLLRKIDPTAEISFDIIFGLPGDNYKFFTDTIEFALSLSPIKINFSPLLILPGSPYWFDKEKLGLVFQNNPPYMIISNKHYSVEDMHKTRPFVIGIMIVLYFPAIRDTIYKMCQQHPEHKIIDTIKKLLIQFEKKSSISIDSINQEDDIQTSLTSYYKGIKRIMNEVYIPQNCLYMYESALELLNDSNMQNLNTEIVMGINYYNAVIFNTKISNQNLYNRIKFEWFSNEQLVEQKK